MAAKLSFLEFDISQLRTTYVGLLAVSCSSLINHDSKIFTFICVLDSLNACKSSFVNRLRLLIELGIILAFIDTPRSSVLRVK